MCTIKLVKMYSKGSNSILNGFGCKIVQWYSADLSAVSWYTTCSVMTAITQPVNLLMRQQSSKNRVQRRLLQEALIPNQQTTSEELHSAACEWSYVQWLLICAFHCSMRLKMCGLYLCRWSNWLTMESQSQVASRKATKKIRLSPVQGFISSPL